VDARPVAVGDADLAVCDWGSGDPILFLPQQWGMMSRQARRSGLVMGLDTHMIAGSRACSTSTRPTDPTITN
jgi:hypothetical protein